MKSGNSGQDQTDRVVIVIGREFGSGGRSIGKLVAKKLGIDYYDKELLSQAAESLGFAPRFLPLPMSASPRLSDRCFRESTASPIISIPPP